MAVRFAGNLKPTFNETSKFEVIQRKQNSAYEMEDVVDFTFYGRPAEQFERKKYRVQKGVDINSEAVYIVATNMPDSVVVGGNIRYLGKLWKVSSVGYYISEQKTLNQGMMSDEYIISRSRKGLTIQ